MAEEKRVISIDGTEYQPEDLGQDAIQYINQLQAINQRKAVLKMEFDRLEAAESVFMSRLKESLPEAETDLSTAKAGGST